MSPRRTQPPAPPASRSAVRTWVVLAALIAIAGAAAWWRLRPSRAPEPADPLASMDPSHAFDLGLGLAQSGRYVESVPYFQRAAESPLATWRVHHDYSSALHNAAMQSRTVGRVGQRVTRSSVERVAMMRESLRQLDLAASKAFDPTDRARIEVARGTTLGVWGFPLEASECFRRALALDPRVPGVPAEVSPRVAPGRS